MTTPISSLVFDGPHTTPSGGELTRVVVMDEHGCEIGWFTLDAAGHGYGPHAEHPDRALLRFPRGYRQQPFSFYNDVDEGWACPSREGATDAALLEHATRLDTDWYDANSECAHPSEL